MKRIPRNALAIFATTSLVIAVGGGFFLRDNGAQSQGATRPQSAGQGDGARSLGSGPVDGIGPLRGDGPLQGAGPLQGNMPLVVGTPVGMANPIAGIKGPPLTAASLLPNMTLAMPFVLGPPPQLPGDPSLPSDPGPQGQPSIVCVTCFLPPPPPAPTPPPNNIINCANVTCS